MANEKEFVERVHKGEVTKAEAKQFLNSPNTDIGNVLTLYTTIILADKEINSIILSNLAKLIDFCNLVLENPNSSPKEKDKALDLLVKVADIMNGIRKDKQIFWIVMIISTALAVSVPMIVRILKQSKK